VNSPKESIGAKKHPKGQKTSVLLIANANNTVFVLKKCYLASSAVSHYCMTTTGKPKNESMQKQHACKH